jgi:hypothetical protein
VTRVIHGGSHRLALRPDRLAEASEWIKRQRTRWEAPFDARTGRLPVHDR